jgi:hypothetical protein
VHLQVAFLDAHREQKIIVYFLTCACVELHALLLKRLPQLKGLQVSALHGKLKQVRLLAVMQPALFVLHQCCAAAEQVKCQQCMGR